MSVEPFIKCSDVNRSLRFYTEVLDFTVALAPDPDPNAFMSKYAEIERAGSLVHLSAHEGDGVFGNQIYVRNEDVENLFESFVARGLDVSQPRQQPGLRMPLVKQTWGMKEFAVADPDGNKITCGQPLRVETDSS